MDFFCSTMHKLKPTDKAHTITFECLIKVHGIKQFVDVYRESRLSQILIDPLRFEEHRLSTWGVHAYSQGHCSGPWILLILLFQVLLRELSQQTEDIIQIIFRPNWTERKDFYPQLGEVFFSLFAILRDDNLRTSWLWSSEEPRESQTIGAGALIFPFLAPSHLQTSCPMRKQMIDCPVVSFCCY